MRRRLNPSRRAITGIRKDRPAVTLLTFDYSCVS